MTTPDDRVRADWTATPTPIDTSTTAGKIAVMQAGDRGDALEIRIRTTNGIEDRWRPVEFSPTGHPNGLWDWSRFDYRIAPPAPPVTALARAAALVDDSATIPFEVSESYLRSLVDEIRAAPTMTVHGDTHLKQVHMSLGAMQPGRYRLVRDDE